MSKAIGVFDYDDLIWHMKGLGPTDYVTACGMDGDDPMVGQFPGPNPKRGQKITCQQCRHIFYRFEELGMKASDFAC